MGDGAKLRIDLPIIVEGRYDKSKLASMVDADIITTEGFGIFSDRSKLDMIRRLAEKGGIIVLTDSDRAGFRIRGHIAGAVPPDRIIHIYIPEILGREPRKRTPSAAGTLGVEGMPSEILRRAFEQAGVLSAGDGGRPAPGPSVTKALLYELGLCGRENSGIMRRRLCLRLGLPAGLSANALPAVLSRIMSQEELRRAAGELFREE